MKCPECVGRLLGLVAARPAMRWSERGRERESDALCAPPLAEFSLRGRVLDVCSGGGGIALRAAGGLLISRFTYIYVYKYNQKLPQFFMGPCIWLCG